MPRRRRSRALLTRSCLPNSLGRSPPTSRKSGLRSRVSWRESFRWTTSKSLTAAPPEARLPLCGPARPTFPTISSLRSTLNSAVRPPQLSIATPSTPPPSPPCREALMPKTPNSLPPTSLPRAAYAHMFGPTTGDRVRLADTELVIEVEKDFTTYGEEVKFGGGKVIRDGMGQSQAARARGAVDTVITNALILDHWRIVKADVGLRDGLIAAIGKAGNPDIQPGVTIIVGPGTEVIAGEGKILTAGGFDTHIHFICPQQVDDALMSGLTTLLGGGTGPSHGTFAPTCTPG